MHRIAAGGTHMSDEASAKLPSRSLRYSAEERERVDTETEFEKKWKIEKERKEGESWHIAGDLRLLVATMLS